MIKARIWIAEQTREAKHENSNWNLLGWIIFIRSIKTSICYILFFCSFAKLDLPSTPVRLANNEAFLEFDETLSWILILIFFAAQFWKICQLFIVQKLHLIVDLNILICKSPMKIQKKSFRFAKIMVTKKFTRLAKFNLEVTARKFQ